MIKGRHARVFEESAIQFLRTELDTGMTFLHTAADATYAAKKKRNRVNARKAYDAIVRFLPESPLTGDEAAEVRMRLEELRLGLKSLGEEI